MRKKAKRYLTQVATLMGKTSEAEFFWRKDTMSAEIFGIFSDFQSICQKLGFFRIGSNLSYLRITFYALRFTFHVSRFT